MIQIRLAKVKVTVDRPAARAVAMTAVAARVVTYTRATLADAIATCPRGETGILATKHQVRIRRSANQIKATISNTARYAAAVHDGSRPHRITVRARGRRTRRTLRFTIGGTVIYRRTVWHPGTTGQPWLRDAGRRVAAAQGWDWNDTDGSAE